MALQISLYTEDLAPAAQAFNERMRRGNAPSEFLLPDKPPVPEDRRSRRIQSSYYLGTDGGLVRGGFVLVEYPAWLAGEEIRATDCMAPLSEGIVDPAYSMVGMHFIRYLQKNARHALAVGMGAVNNPFPRLLKASGWTVREVPFFFRICRAGRFFREMRVFERSAPLRILARIAAATGAGYLGAAALQSRGLAAAWRASQLATETPADWGDWADDIWQRFRAECSFAISRDRETLRELYPPTEPRLVRFLVRQRNRPVAWAAALLTQMSGDKFFGNLKVATILDCPGDFATMAPAILAVTRALAARGADLVITNQSHRACQAAFRSAGYLRGPSNYCVGVSKAIAGIALAGSGEERIYITRGDGDGRMHL